MTQEQYDWLVTDSKDKHSCLCFADELIHRHQIGLFIPSRTLTLPQLKAYLTGFGLIEADIVLTPIHKHPRNAPFGGYVVMIPQSGP
ncbi:hypothetical protein [Spirosoma endbachense]|uniref:Uncharacterized protein n=1 Tax=Spirosoma endbachense TaxID=2666025 RepID=A0A6P1W303_9BACT|nr:hypothetical protein [Spirosoma endbachense]QHV98682.1 hypothetical protein GJR95_28375 [Spirosoma endbachense]